MTNFIGIDFGTTKCAIAWVPPGRDTAEIIHNAEGHAITPSAIYYGSGAEPIVGEFAADMAEHETEWTRVVMGIKRDLLRAAALRVGGQRIQPVDAAAAILAKLRADAERGVFRDQPLTRAVITHPAAFDPTQRDKLHEAAQQAGFTEVDLLPEPVAAAIAYERWLERSGDPVRTGDHILVYDFGGGTFDLAVLVRDEDGSFREALAPEGLSQRGGNDLDLALYDHLEQQALARHQRGFGDSDTFHLPTLRLSREWKERLTAAPRVPVSVWLPPEGEAPAMRFTDHLDRTEFEQLIDAEFIEPTVRLTKATWERAVTLAGSPEKVKVVLIGGATRVPLVERRLREALPVTPHAWDRRDLAVALGAAWHGQAVWGNERPGTTPTPASTPRPAPTPEPDLVEEQPAAPSPEAEITIEPDPTTRQFVVDSRGNGDFTTIPPAIAAAMPGDTILLRRGTYPGNLVLRKPVRIIGDGGPGAVLLEHEGGTVITSTAPTGLLRNLHIRQTGRAPESGGGVDIEAGNMTIEQCDITAQGGPCVAVSGDAALTIHGCTIHDGFAEGVWVDTDATATIVDNDITANASQGIIVWSDLPVIIRNNRIHAGYDMGIWLLSGSGAVIEHNDIFGNADDNLFISGGHTAIVRKNRIHGGRSDGIEINFEDEPAEEQCTIEDNDIFDNANHGVSIVSRGLATVRNNRIHKNKETGIWFYDQSGGTIENNDIYSNMLSGIEISSGSNPAVQKNRVHRNGQAGVHLHTQATGTIEDNDIFSNSPYGGVLIKSGSTPVLKRNRIHDNGPAGVLVYKQGEGTIEDNDIFANDRQGIVIHTGGDPEIHGNHIRENQAAGIYVYEQGKGTIKDNEVFGNVDMGVSIATGGDPLILKNRIRDNNGSGIVVSRQGKGTIEDNDIRGNALPGVLVLSGGDPTVRINRVNGHAGHGVSIADSGGGTFLDNDLSGNDKGAWSIDATSESMIARRGNRE